MNTTESVSAIQLPGIWTLQAKNDFDAEFKDALQDVQNEFWLDAFCRSGGEIEDVDFYEFELDESTDQKVAGIIHVSFVENCSKTFLKPHHLRYAFELNRPLGELHLGEGVEDLQKDLIFA